MPFFKLLNNGMGLSFVAFFTNDVCVVASGYGCDFKNKLEYIFKGLKEVVCVERNMRAGPFINRFNNQIYERSV